MMTPSSELPEEGTWCFRGEADQASSLRATKMNQDAYILDSSLLITQAFLVAQR